MLLAVISCYLLLSVVICCYPLLFVVIRCYLLLSVVICCYLDNDKYPKRYSTCDMVTGGMGLWIHKVYDVFHSQMLVTNVANCVVGGP